ncbi:MAG: hypothetical protein R3E32_25390 [Chitinophagales bacterium]
MLARKLNPFNKKKIGPTILTNITQSMYMASNHLQDRVYADSNIDLFIVPPISEADSMTLDASVQLYGLGSSKILVEQLKTFVVSFLPHAT